MSAADVLKKPHSSERAIKASKSSRNTNLGKTGDVELDGNANVGHDDLTTAIAKKPVMGKTARLLVWALVVLSLLASMVYIWRTYEHSQSGYDHRHGRRSNIHSSASFIEAGYEAGQDNPRPLHWSDRGDSEKRENSADGSKVIRSSEGKGEKHANSVDLSLGDSLLADLNTSELLKVGAIRADFESELPNAHKFDVIPPKRLKRFASKPNHPFRGSSGLAGSLLDLGRLPPEAVPIHIAKLHNWAFHGWLQNLQSQRIDPVGGYTVVHYDTHSDMFGTYLHGGILRASGISRIGRASTFRPIPGLTSPSKEHDISSEYHPKLTEEAYLAAQAIVSGADRNKLDDFGMDSSVSSNKLNYLQITQLTRMLTIANYIPAAVMLGSDLKYSLEDGASTNNTEHSGGSKKESSAEKKGQFIDHVVWVRPEIDAELNNPPNAGDWNITVGFMHLLHRDVPETDPRYGLPRNATLAQFLGSQLVDVDMVGGLVGLANVLNSTEDPFAGSEWRPALRVNEFVSKIAYRYDGLFCCTSRGVIDAAFCNGFEDWDDKKYNKTMFGNNGRVSVFGDVSGSNKPVFGLDAFKTDEELRLERDAALQESGMKEMAKSEKEHFKAMRRKSTNYEKTQSEMSPWSSYMEGLVKNPPRKPLSTYPSRTFRLTVTSPRQFIRMLDPTNEYVKTMDKHVEESFNSSEDKVASKELDGKKSAAFVSKDEMIQLPKLNLRPGSVLLDIDLDYFASTSEVRGMAVAEGIDGEAVNFAAETIRACCGHKTRFGDKNSGCCAYLPHRIRYLRLLLSKLLEAMIPDVPEFDALLKRMNGLASQWSDSLLEKAASLAPTLPEHLRIPLQCPILNELASNVTTRLAEDTTSEVDRSFFFAMMKPPDGDLFSLEPNQEGPVQTQLSDAEYDVVAFMTAFIAHDDDDYDDDHEREEDHRVSRKKRNDNSSSRRSPLSLNEKNELQNPLLKHSLRVNRTEVIADAVHDYASDTNMLQNHTDNARAILAINSSNTKHRVRFSRAERKRRTRERVQAMRRETELVRMLRSMQKKTTDSEISVVQSNAETDTGLATKEKAREKSGIAHRLAQLQTQTVSSLNRPDQPSQASKVETNTPLNLKENDKQAGESASYTEPLEESLRKVSDHVGIVSPISRKLNSYESQLQGPAHRFTFGSSDASPSPEEGTAASYTKRWSRSGKKREGKRHSKKKVYGRSIEEELTSERARFSSSISKQYTSMEQEFEEMENADAFCRMIEFSEHLPSTKKLPNGGSARSRATGKKYHATYSTQYLMRATRGLREALKYLAPVTRVVTIARSNDVFLPPQLTQEVEWLVLSALHDSGLGLMRVVDNETKKADFIRLVQHDHSQSPSARPEGMCAYKFPFCVNFNQSDESLFWESPYVHSGIGGSGAEKRRLLKSRTSPPDESGAVFY